MFNKVMNLLSDYDSNFNTDMFRIISRRMIEEIKKFKEMKPSLTFIMSLVNFPSAKIKVKFGKRTEGKTNYSFKRQVNMGVDSILSFSTKPLRIISLIGLFFSVISFFYLLLVLIQKLFIDYGGIGWGTIVVLIIFFGGLQLFAIGVIGEYIGRIFLQSKDRPLYTIDEIIEDVIPEKSKID